MKSAIGLFNQKGLVNVRLQQIADEAGISVGNLAYHYYSKKAIVLAIDSELGEELELLLSIDQNFPSLLDFDNHLGRYFFILNRYSFYFLDLLEIERAYPKLHSKRVNYVEKMIAQIQEWLLLNVEKEILRPEKMENQYQHLAESIWMIITFWLTQRQVRGKTDIGEGHFKEFIWNQLIPLFTKAGWMEFEAVILPQLKFYLDQSISLDFRKLP
ncbi:TetR/AcrR family transcriptional regulator [Flagellimonas allohymeniacidonis]|uniref:TetR/AcrR family transcriptional regulator n=1 Tax=Flagellimonas allohymeniacidonis TaxID=2517819 RepID=A0A4Q8QFP0_9FLAO|nr:TetR/AcrR family transcriptional regulator [Allomuricauda hymeniacidonis]TAI49261.1 TetR/AcrR family transcriptional regulator [Allomuricauda hymeniacidonis]